MVIAPALELHHSATKHDYLDVNIELKVSATTNICLYFVLWGENGCLNKKKKDVAEKCFIYSILLEGEHGNIAFHMFYKLYTKN